MIATGTVELNGQDFDAVVPMMLAEAKPFLKQLGLDLIVTVCKSDNAAKWFSGDRRDGTEVHAVYAVNVEDPEEDWVPIWQAQGNV